MKIQTARCTIRYFKEHDIPDFMKYRNNLEWMQYQGFKGLTKQAYKEALLGEHSPQEGIQLAVICNQSNILIWDIYLKQENDNCWIGYTIAPTQAHQGYAYEVVSAMIAVLKCKGIQCVKASVDNDNIASIALLRKLNFTYIGLDDNELIFTLQL